MWSSCSTCSVLEWWRWSIICFNLASVKLDKIAFITESLLWIIVDNCNFYFPANKALQCVHAILDPWATVSRAESNVRCVHSGRSFRPPLTVNHWHDAGRADTLSTAPRRFLSLQAWVNNQLIGYKWCHLLHSSVNNHISNIKYLFWACVAVKLMTAAISCKERYRCSLSVCMCGLPRKKTWNQKTRRRFTAIKNTFFNNWTGSGGKGLEKSARGWMSTHTCTRAMLGSLINLKGQRLKASSRGLHFFFSLL